MYKRQEVNHTVNVVLRENLRNGFLIRNVRPNKRIIRIVLNVLQVLKVSRIREDVHIDDADRISVFAEHVVNVIRTDKTGSPCYQISSHLILHLFPILAVSIIHGRFTAISLFILS